MNSVLTIETTAPATILPTSIEVTDHDLYDSHSFTWLTDPSIMKHVNQIRETIPGIADIAIGQFVYNKSTDEFLLWDKIPKTTKRAVRKATRDIQEVIESHWGQIQGEHLEEANRQQKDEDQRQVQF